MRELCTVKRFSKSQELYFKRSNITLTRSHITNMGNIGCYPVEYNPKVHGPYSPARYYGPRDIPFGEVKLQDVPAWLSHRKFNPIRTIDRAYWRWVFKYSDVRKGGFSWIMQLAFFMAAGSYMLRYNQHKYERHAKYH